MSAEADLRERQAINEGHALLDRGAPPERVAAMLEDAHHAIEDLRRADAEVTS